MVDKYEERVAVNTLESVLAISLNPSYSSAGPPIELENLEEPPYASASKVAPPGTEMKPIENEYEEIPV